MISVLSSNVAGTVAAQTGVASNKTPFLPNRVVAAVINIGGATGTAAVVKIQSSPDNSTWTDQLVNTGLGTMVGNVTMDAYMRATVTTAAGTLPGTYTAYLQSGD